MTPDSITDDIRYLVSKLGRTDGLGFLVCQPDPEAMINECFPSVDKKILKSGGRRILGWQIWETPIILQAEFHAVWESPDGCLIDITPKPIPLSRILFVIDNGAKYEGKQVNSIRHNITSNKLVDGFIKVCDAVFSIENAGDRTFRHNISLQDEDARAYKLLTNARGLLEAMAFNGETRESLCPCGCGNPFKDCFGGKINDVASSF